MRKLAASRKRKERQIVATRKRVKAATLHSQPIGAFLDRASAPRVEPPLTDETAEEVGRMHNLYMYCTCTVYLLHSRASMK